MAYSFNQPFVNYQNPYQQVQPWQQMQQPMQQTLQQPAQAQQQPVQQAGPGIRGKVVSGEEEARNTLIELDGSVFFFPDANGGRIYTKQINPADFSPIFKTYQVVEAQPKAEVVPQFDTSMFAQRDEVEQLKATIATMQEHLDRLTAPASASVSKEVKAK